MLEACLDYNPILHFSPSLGWHHLSSFFPLKCGLTYTFWSWGKGGLRQEDCEFEVRLVYIVRSYLKKTKK
jgi:hypothetical protein